MKKRIVCMVLALVLSFALGSAAFAASASPGSSVVNGSAAYVYRLVPTPTFGNVGGEWTIIGLARSGYSFPEKYYQDYYASLEQLVKDKGGKIHLGVYSEYARVVIALAAIGKDATDVGGYNLLMPLADYTSVISQGLNGPIWALIALNTRGYSMPTAPAGATQATKQMYVDYIVRNQLSDGGWSLRNTGSADPDITGMALQALSKYQSQTSVKNAINKALDCISAMQNDDGGFDSYYGFATSESCAQIVVGLCECGVSLTDPRFVKNGKSPLDGLLSYRRSGGNFVHSGEESGNNLTASEQGLYALVAAQRAANGQNSLYSMSDAITITTPVAPAFGLPGKDPAVNKVPVTAAGTTFPDIAGHPNKAAIEALAARGILNGYSASQFGPNDLMTRAQFAKVTICSLGMSGQATNAFSDVPADAWYAGWVGRANAYGIVNGIGGGKFDPDGKITREQAAKMVAVAAKLCGMNTDAYSTAAAQRDVLAAYSDYLTVSSWALPYVAFCYDQGILDASVTKINPQEQIKRGEIAQMFYNMLAKAKLL